MAVPPLSAGSTSGPASLSPHGVRPQLGPPVPDGQMVSGRAPPGAQPHTDTGQPESGLPGKRSLVSTRELEARSEQTRRSRCHGGASLLGITRPHIECGARKAVRDDDRAEGSVPTSHTRRPAEGSFLQPPEAEFTGRPGGQRC